MKDIMFQLILGQVMDAELLAINGTLICCLSIKEDKLFILQELKAALQAH